MALNPNILAFKDKPSFAEGSAGRPTYSTKWLQHDPNGLFNLDDLLPFATEENGYNHEMTSQSVFDMIVSAGFFDDF